jgi:uncharacterized integral membrane protein
LAASPQVILLAPMLVSRESPGISANARPRPKMSIKLLIVLLLMLVVTFFSVQNAETITVRFLFWQFAMSQALVIMLAAICGALAGGIAGAVMARRRSARPAPSSEKF